jgi:hypothetical protein
MVPLRKLLVSERSPSLAKAITSGPLQTPTDELNIFQKVDLKDSAGAKVKVKQGILLQEECVRICTKEFSGQ